VDQDQFARERHDEPEDYDGEGLLGGELAKGKALDERENEFTSSLT